ncbi:MAG TPA: rod shape-determining protein MreC [Candidatus Paceibacterota bacterium]|nr:rod shape-determining protein MreC [Candidatus Paceibacterota bacterium]
MGRKRVSNDHWISGALIIILAALIFFVPSYGWDLRAWLSRTPGGPSGQTSTATDASSSEDQTLAAENDILASQLAELQVVASELPTSTAGEIRAMVYSRYPLNFRNQLLTNAGSDSGVASGAAVMFQGMLIGRVQTVFSNTSLVQTIFDNVFKMPVRIGSGGADGLLEGGSYPTIGSIAIGAAVAPGDIVYSAAPGIPYGLPIAQVVATSTSADSLFEQATLAFPYDVNNIETVLIMK